MLAQTYLLGQTHVLGQTHGNRILTPHGGV